MQVGQFIIYPSYGFPVSCSSKSAHLTGFVQIIHIQNWWKHGNKFKYVNHVKDENFSYIFLNALALENMTPVKGETRVLKIHLSTSWLRG